VKVVRILQVLALALLAGYLVVFQSANPNPVTLPFVGAVSAALLLAAGLVLAWLTGYVPNRWRAWSLTRRVKALEKENATLQLELESARRSEPSDPVIPDRASAQIPRGGDPSDYL